MMETVRLAPLFHRGYESVGIYFNVGAKLQAQIRQVKGMRWSASHKCWYIRYEPEIYEDLLVTLKKYAVIEDSAMNDYRSRKVYVNKIQQIAVENVSRGNLPLVLYEISVHNLSQLERMMELLQLKSYSSSTIKTYKNEFGAFLRLLKDKPVEELTAEQVRRYILYCVNTLHLSENTIHSRLNALKFYYEQVLHNEKIFFEIPRPKRPILLPKLLNETELGRLFNALTNKKHKAMLFTAYSGGLRVSEVVSLKLSDIDSKRMQIFISRAKGKKDRYVNLSPVLLDILREYVADFKPKKYLFESSQTGMQYPIRTVQQIFTIARQKGGIKKEVGIHSLRHSFATHLLEKGTDIKYIKDILGHYNIKTTERYLHVSRKALVNIISPLDDLMRNEQIDW
jgi:integrase/recombinase XerD